MSFRAPKEFFLDPSHSLGMTRISPSPLRPIAFAGDNPTFLLRPLRPFFPSIAAVPRVLFAVIFRFRISSVVSLFLSPIVLGNHRSQAMLLGMGNR